MGFRAAAGDDALSPANNLATNPEAMQLALETGGKSLVEGLQLFTEDLAKGRISMTDATAFEVGKNVCTTPGTVIFQNELIQLIQYTPTTGQVFARPLVIVPPCINKYYILDLQPANSFVGHAVEQGHTVFLVSWRNAGPDQQTLTWDDYLTSGVMKAIEVAQSISGADQVNTLGLRRRHPAGQCAGDRRGARRATGGQRDAADHPAGLHRHRRYRAAGHRGRRRTEGSCHWQGRRHERQ